MKTKVVDLHQLSDEDLKAMASKMKSDRIIHAFIIGFLVGIVLFSLYHKSFSLLMLIPLYLVFRVFHRPENNQKYKEVLLLVKERNLH